MVTGRRYGPAMLRALAEVVFPAVCPGCGGRGEPVCAACARDDPAARRCCRHRSGSTRCTCRSRTPAWCASSWPVAKYRRRHAALAWLAARDDRASSAPSRSTSSRGRRRRRPGAGRAASTRPRCSRPPSPARSAARAVACCAGSATTTRPGTRVPSASARPSSRSRAAARIAGRRVLVVDDVVTTGATLPCRGERAAAAGAASVSGVAAARRA